MSIDIQPLAVDTRGVAALIGVKLDTVQLVVTRPDFPRPIIPTGKPNGKRVWLVEDVQAWLRASKEPEAV